MVQKLKNYKASGSSAGLSAESPKSRKAGKGHAVTAETSLNRGKINWPCRRGWILNFSEQRRKRGAGLPICILVCCFNLHFLLHPTKLFWDFYKASGMLCFQAALRNATSYSNYRRPVHKYTHTHASRSYAAHPEDTQLHKAR